MKDTWRDRARPIIAGVIETHGTADMKTLRTLLWQAYPFGEKKYHPYKVWLKLKRPAPRHDPLPGQMTLFD